MRKGIMEPNSEMSLQIALQKLFCLPDWPYLAYWTTYWHMRISSLDRIFFFASAASSSGAYFSTVHPKIVLQIVGWSSNQDTVPCIVISIIPFVIKIRDYGVLSSLRITFSERRILVVSSSLFKVITIMRVADLSQYDYICFVNLLSKIWHDFQ